MSQRDTIDRRRRIDRRTFVAGAAGTSLVGLAGCLDGEDVDPEGGMDDDDGTGDGDGADPGDDATEMVMVTSDSGTAAFAASQGIAAAVNENTDEVFVDGRPSQGTEANVGRLARREAQIGYIQNWTANEILEGVEPFDDLGFTPCQTFHLYDLPWLFGTANEGWESVTDIEPDSRVNPTPRGSGTAPALERALQEHAGVDYDRVSFEFGELGGAFNEGRLDVGAVTILNFVIEPGWLDEIKSTVDLRILGWPEDAVEAMEEDPSLLPQEVDMTGFDGYAFAPDAVAAPTFAYNFVVRNDFDYDAMYAFMETLFEVREELDTYHGLLGFHADLEFWVRNMYEGMPFHPAAADFYEEQGVWRDEFERYED